MEDQRKKLETIGNNVVHDPQDEKAKKCVTL